MKGLIAFEAIGNVSDDLVMEAVDMLGLLHAPAVAPRSSVKDTPRHRFFSSGWGVACVSLFVAFAVLGGIIYAGRQTPSTVLPGDTVTEAPVSEETISEETISEETDIEDTVSKETEISPDTTRETNPENDPTTDTEKDSESESTAASEESTETETESEKPHDVHVWGDWEFIHPPTCTEEGARARRCTHGDCLTMQQETLPAGRHVYGGTSHCLHCSQTLSRNDTFLTFTSNGDGTCSIGCNADGEYLDPVLVLPNYSPDGDLVTAIEEAAFRGRFSSIHATTYFAGRYLTSVTLPAALETIGDYSFDWCEQLTEIIFPDTLRHIGEYAFHTNGITALTLPDGVISIDYYAFGDCPQLQSVNIPASVAEIGMYAFGGCRSLENIVFDEESALTAIPPLFAEFCSSLTEIHLPDTVTHIGWSAFSDCTALTSIILPENLIEIGDGAFLNCQNLSSVRYPDSLTRVGWRPFRNTALTITRWEGCLYVAMGDNPYAILSYAEESKEISMQVHPDTRIIALAAFSDCPKVTELTYGGTVEEWNTIHHTIPEWPDSLIRTVVCTDGSVTIEKLDVELP